MFGKKLAIALVLCLGVISGSARAAIDLSTPAGLNPGDQFRFAFVTSGGIRGWNNLLEHFDDFVNSAATTAGLQYDGQALQWKALVSAWNDPYAQVTVAAIDRLPATSPALYLLDGTLLASSGADLWDGTIHQPFDVNENVQTLPSPGFVWTGTYANGTSNPSIRLGVFQPEYGRTDSQAASWIAHNVTIWDATYRVYAFSEVLAVPSGILTPEPASMTLWSLTVVASAAAYLRRRKSQAL